MKFYTEENKVIKSWCNNPEDGTIDQARNLANLPFLFKHVALMPDGHQGYGMPIGGVIACNSVVIPNAVGVDIGCGMAVVKTTLTEITISELKTIMSGIRKRIPVGFSHHKRMQDFSLMPELTDEKIVSEQYLSASRQLGTLGGGNHFIEIQKGSDGHIWIMIHSGSRNLGYKVAKYYNEIAKEANKKWYTQVDPKNDLAFLPIDMDDCQNYLKEMEYCLKFAKANRALMIENIKCAFGEVFAEISFDNFIDIHHNYVAIENHFGKNVWIHRKGATSAKEGQTGIIPGSQGTSSYIVRGKGNPDSFKSCSHGAGRKMGRKEARKSLNLEDEQKKLDGVIHSVRSEKDLDEACGAYKNINIVMEEQKDLVDIVIRMEPLAVIKG